jgi:hypothetical protein
MTTISTATNPAMANNLVQKTINDLEAKESVYEPVLSAPSDTYVMLPGGYVTSTGEVVREAEIRELTGLDEEAIARTTSLAKAILTIINRGTVRIGDEKASEKILDDLLSGDRDALLLAIFKTTFGTTADVSAYCGGCQDVKSVTLDLNEDIKTRVLVNPANDRFFTVQCKAGDVLVQLPTGRAQKELINNAEKTSAELNTILLENCIMQINGTPVISKAQVQGLGLGDRRKITEEINSRVPGPQYEDITIDCPDCGGKVVVPINLGTLFRL